MGLVMCIILLQILLYQLLIAINTDEDECEECCPGWWLRTSVGQLVRWTKVDQGGTNRLPVIKQAPIH